MPANQPEIPYTKREQRAWYMYDFANSAFASTVVTLFLGPYLTVLAKSAADSGGHIYPLGIQVDPRDWLVTQGADGVALTWMDARVEEWVVTPRKGKPVEINALWYNALMSMTRLARKLGRQERGYDDMARRVGNSFARFWNPAANCLFDVLDGPDGLAEVQEVRGEHRGGDFDHDGGGCSPFKAGW